MPPKRKVVRDDGLEYESVSDAARDVGSSTQNICYAIKLGHKCAGYSWRYKDTNFVESVKQYKRAIVRSDGIEYESLLKASISNMLSRSSLIQVIKSKRMYNGYTYRYKTPRNYNDEELLPGEIWLQHPQHSIIVSNLGRINHSRITTGTTTPQGYKQIQVKGKFYRVHRLVAETFHPNPEGFPQVDHIDEDKTNNKASNLRWCSARQNSNWYIEKK